MGGSVKDHVVEQLSAESAIREPQDTAKGRSLHLSEPQLSHLYNGATNQNHHIQVLLG